MKTVIHQSVKQTTKLCILVAITLLYILNGPILARSGPLGEETLPVKAFIVFTPESWGCIGTQEIKEDITDLIVREDGKFVRLEEIKNPEDRNDRYELYLYFDTKGISKLAGYYVLRLRINHQNPQRKGLLLVDQARLVSRNKGHFIELKAKAEGLLKADLFYAKHPELKTAFFYCPEADLFDPSKISFLNIYEVKSDLKIESKIIDKEWNNITVAIDSFLLKEAKHVNECGELLDRLDKTLSISKDFLFLWYKSKVTPKNIENIVLQLERETRLKYKVLIKIRYKNKTEEEVNWSEKLFTPKLRQKITVKEASDQLVGGEIWIGVELPE